MNCTCRGAPEVAPLVEAWPERRPAFFAVLVYSACAAVYRLGTLYRFTTFSAQRVIGPAWDIRPQERFVSETGASVRRLARFHETAKPLG
jgi:hypothetical protein